MTKIAYLECPTGIAGDMCLGALVDAGVPLEYLSAALDQLGISQEYQLRADRVHRNGQHATKVHVDLQPHHSHAAPPDRPQNQPHFGEDSSTTHGSEGGHLQADRPHHKHAHEHPPAPFHRDVHEHPHPPSHGHSHKPSVNAHRHLPEIETMIQQAKLPDRVTAWSLAVFRRLAEAEGAVHGISPEQVHFHEVGATDAIVDIVGTCLGLDWLGIEQLYCSAIPVGGGTIYAAHGRLPVPAPAVLKLWELRQIPIYSNGIDRELVTPTGAAIATTLATQFGPPPAMTLLKVGLGAGTIELPLPNILRLWIGKTPSQQWLPRQALTFGVQPQATQPPVEHNSTELDTVALLETQIDDLNPQAIGYVFEELLAAGALDVFTQAIAMKKSRPGVLLTVLCAPDQIDTCEAILFRETTTLGIRRSLQQRRILERAIQPVQTHYGTVRVKIAWSSSPAEAAASDHVLTKGATPPTNIQPEYEDCAQLARQHNIPWRKIHQLAVQQWQAEYGDKA